MRLHTHDKYHFLTYRPNCFSIRQIHYQELEFMYLAVQVNICLKIVLLDMFFFVCMSVTVIN